MSKFNRKTNTKEDATNIAGFKGFERKDIKKEIVSVILNSMLNGNSFYETEEDRLLKIQSVVKENKEMSEFLAKAMVYTRLEGNLRSVSHYMGVLLSEDIKGETYLRKALSKIMKRPDDATEMIALWNGRNENENIPNALRRSIRDSLENRWDAYQLRKYFGGRNSIKVSDLIKLSKPTPRNDEQSIIFKQALEGNLPSIDTAQTVNAGTTGDQRIEKYADMLKNKKLGYMASLKNIKNILEGNPSDEVIYDLCMLLETEKAVLNSGVLPFRFVQAYQIVKNLSMDRIKLNRILNSIEKGFIISAKNVNIAEEGEAVAILLDESGSMQGWHNKTVTPFSIGKTLMASMLTGLDKNFTLGYLWADSARRISIDSGPMQFIENTKTKGGGTNLGRAIQDLIDTKTVVDKLVIFTDMQQNSIGGYGRATFKEMLKEYKKISPKVKVLFWNLEGYGGATPLKLNKDVLEVSGFSDKMLSVIPKLWKDKEALIKEIEKIKL